MSNTTGIPDASAQFEAWWAEINKHGTFPEEWHHPVKSGYLEGWAAGRRAMQDGQEAAR